MSNYSQEQFVKIQRKYKLTKYPSEITKISGEPYFKLDTTLTLKCSKERSIPFMIENLLKQDKRKFTISSSGNASKVAVWCALNNPEIEDLKVYLSSKFNYNKYLVLFQMSDLGLMKNNFIRKKNFKYKNIQFSFSDTPRKDASKDINDGYYLLRGSVDDNSFWGYASIIEELNEQMSNLKKIKNIFIPASSGSTVIGIFQATQDANLKIRFHVVQTTKVYTLIKKMLKNIQPELDHPADSIVDIVGNLRGRIEDIIRSTNGTANVISADECILALNYLKNNLKINDVSYDSALGYAAFLSQSKKDSSINSENSLILFTG
ncbi:MAG: PLP-dependent lyase/thiolase [Candidatus Dojkabacteria bacterium]|nr:PLP-dependent lyase/thiolase [Candidatus Dojkabacteria bacterium]